MKRITVSLPDEVADKVKRAAGGDGKVSAFVAEALKAYLEQETLSDVLAAWERETPVPPEVQQQAHEELMRAGLGPVPPADSRLAG